MEEERISFGNVLEKKSSSIIDTYGYMIRFINSSSLVNYTPYGVSTYLSLLEGSDQQNRRHSYKIHRSRKVPMCSNRIGRRTALIL